MGRICGSLGIQSSADKMAKFLSSSSLGGNPARPNDSFFIHGDVALAAKGQGGFYQSPDGRYTCMVDGKVFAAPTLLESLDNGEEDIDPTHFSQILMRCYLYGGLKFLSQVPGGYVFSIWDERERKLILGRDRFGIKRIYYFKGQNGYFFSSNLTALVRLPDYGGGINPDGFVEYMSYGFVCPPHTIYKNVYTLDPGEACIYENNRIVNESFHPIVPETWRFLDMQDQTEEELVDRLEALFVDSIQRRLPEGPEVATYLSGGYDTSLVCAALKHNTSKKVIAYTLGSNDPECDEVPHAREIAKHLGVQDHHSYYIREEDFFDALYALPEVYGQPFADISAIPNYIIAREVSERHDTIFAGDGPDFMYSGINFRIWHYYYMLTPYVLRIPLSKVLDFVIQKFYKGWTSPNIHASELLRQPAFSWIFHKKFKSHELERLIKKSVDPKRFWVHRYLKSRRDIPLYERLRLAFFIAFGTHGVLYKGTGVHDALGLDFICPYYDPELFDFVNFLPTAYKFQKGKGKYLHKQLLFRHVPRKLLEKPKQGFIINYNEFGIKALRDLTDRYLSRARLQETGLVDAAYATECVENYFRGDARMGPLLWTLLVFEMWRDKFSF